MKPKFMFFSLTTSNLAKLSTFLRALSGGISYSVLVDPSLTDEY